VKELRKRGVLQACPLCRAALPDGSEKLYDDAVQMYVIVNRKVGGGSMSWQTLATSEQTTMAKVRVMLTAAANQGDANALLFLAMMYQHGQGTAQDHSEAIR
jgi:TPR repeat protein